MIQILQTTYVRLLLKAGWLPIGKVITLPAPRISRPGRVMWLASRQGDGDTKTARFGSKTYLLRWFHDRSVSFLGQKTQEHVKTVKKERCLEANNDIFRKNAF